MLRLIPVRRPTWVPLQRPGSVNGHEGLARQLAPHGGRYTQPDNAVLGLEDFRRAQRWSDRWVSVPLGSPARPVRGPGEPVAARGADLEAVLLGTPPAEYATDLVFCL